MHALRFALTLLLLPAVVHAYELWLDIDTDGDPTTINEVTEETTVDVKVVLRPSVTGEVFSLAQFGEGGQCVDCNSSANYGARWSIPQPMDPRITGWDEVCATTDACLGDVWSAHCLFTAIADVPFSLNEPIFIATFTATVVHPILPDCVLPPATLAALSAAAPGPLPFWNYVEIGAVPVPAETSTWGQVKAVYR